MWSLIVWALGTGAVTGAAWVSIVLVGRRRRIRAEQALQLDQVWERAQRLRPISDRVAEVEQRMDLAERRLTDHRTERVAEKLPPTP